MLTMRISLPRSRAMLALGAAMSLFAAVGPAGAFSVSPEYLPAPTTDQSTIAVYREGVDAPKIDNVWYCRWGCRGYGWRRGWGWGAPAVVGGLAAGAIIGGALAAPYYAGPYYPGPYGGCWRRVWGYYGWHWVRYC
jgi:hypothetical protein